MKIIFNKNFYFCIAFEFKAKLKNCVIVLVSLPGEEQEASRRHVHLSLLPPGREAPRPPTCLKQRRHFRSSSTDFTIGKKLSRWLY